MQKLASLDMQNCVAYAIDTQTSADKVSNSIDGYGSQLIFPARRQSAAVNDLMIHL
jgi:hypothetical protein